jgi:hypothetical protein
MGKRNFKSPLQKEARSITFISPASLAKDEKSGVILEGTYVESSPNTFNEKKLDFKFSDDKGNMTVINAGGNLGWAMEAINVGDFVQVSYNGKKEIAKGKMAGRMAHDFKVLVDKPEK